MNDDLFTNGPGSPDPIPNWMVGALVGALASVLSLIYFTVFQ